MLRLLHLIDVSVLGDGHAAVAGGALGAHEGAAGVFADLRSVRAGFVARGGLVGGVDVGIVVGVGIEEVGVLVV